MGGGIPSWRTDLYTAKGTLLMYRESTELFKRLGTKMTPELKSPSVAMPFEGDYTQDAYAQQMIDEYKAAGGQAVTLAAVNLVTIDPGQQGLRYTADFGGVRLNGGPQRGGTRLDAPAPAAPHACAPRGKTCSSCSYFSWLHSLKDWSLL